MAWWIPLAAAGAAATTNLGTAYLQKEWNREAANTAWEREREGAEIQHQYYMRRYQDTYQDMVKAGINPIMAASGGFNVGNSVSMPSVPMQHPVQIGDIAGSAKSYGDLIKMEDEKTKIQSETKLNIQTVQNKIAEKTKTLAEHGLIDKQTQVEARKLLVQLEEINKLASEAFKASKQGFLAETEMDQIQTATEALRMQMDKIRKITNVYNQDFGGIVAFINALFGTLNLGVSAGASRIIK